MTRTGWAAAIAAIGSLVCAGCDGRTPSDSDGSAGDAGMADGALPDGGPPMYLDAGPRTDAGPILPCTGLPGVTIENVLTPLHPSSGVLHPGTRTLLSLPQGLSRSLRGVSAVTLTDDAMTIHTLPAAGDPPGGRVVLNTWVPGLDRMISVLWASNPFRYELVATQIRADGITVEPLTAINPPASDGYLFDVLLPRASGVVAVRGSSFYYDVDIDLASHTATWGNPIAISITNPPAIEVADVQGSRALGYGTPRFAPPMSLVWEPSVQTRSLPGGAWTPGLPVSGDVPPSPDSSLGFFDGWLAYDAMSDRLFVVARHEIDIPPFGPTSVPGLWSVPAAGGQFVLHDGEYLEGQAMTGSPYAMDIPSAQRTLEPNYGGITVRSLAMESEGRLLPLTAEGVLPPRFPLGAVRMADGRIVVSDGSLLVWDPSEPGGAYRAFAALDSTIRSGHTLAYDAARDRVLVVGGAQGSVGDPTSFVVTSVSSDGANIATLATTNDPPPRTNHRALVVGDELVIAGGEVSTGALDDVWALSLTTRAWRRVATLARARSRPALRVASDGRLWIVGGYASGGGVASVEVIDLAIGTRSDVAVPGSWPPGNGAFTAWTPVGDAMLAVDLGGTVDEMGNQLWLLEEQAGGARWTGGDACVSDYGLYDIVGVANGGAEGWIAGGGIWRATR